MFLFFFQVTFDQLGEFSSQDSEGEHGNDSQAAAALTIGLFVGVHFCVSKFKMYFLLGTIVPTYL